MKVFILGLDGATMDVLGPLMESGDMPHLAAVASGGARGSILSTRPPTSPVAWSTITTGKNPGKHGVYDFLEFAHDPCGGRVNTSRSVQAETIWEMAARAGLRSIVAGVALTYPLRSNGGLQFGDFLSPPRARDMCTDPTLLAELERELGRYEPWCTAAYHRGNELEVLAELRKFLDYHLNVIRFLLDRRPWDLFCYNLMAVDRMLHEAWHVWDEGHPFRKGRDLREAKAAFVDFYRAIDRAIGEIRSRLPDDGSLVILSDHGNGSVTHYLNLNVWLLREGYLVLKPGRRTAIKRWLFERGKNPAWAYRRLARLGLHEIVTRRLRGGQLGRLDRFTERIFLSKRDIDWARTRAYSQGNYGQIFINLRGRQPNGAVEPAGARSLEAEISKKLLALPSPESGAPLIARVHAAGEIYHGPERRLAPDLTVELRDPRHHTVGLFDFATHKLLMRAFSMSGDHRPDGVLFAGGAGIEPGSRPRGAALCDLAPTVLHLLGVPIPRDLDGRVLEEILTGPARRSPAYEGAEAAPELPRTGGGTDGAGTGGAGTSAAAHMATREEPAAHTPEEEAEIVRRLESLGYL